METVQIECRCKDCEYYDYHLDYDDYYCVFHGYDNPKGMYDNDFCSNGVRKEK